MWPGASWNSVISRYELTQQSPAEIHHQYPPSQPASQPATHTSVTHAARGLPLVASTCASVPDQLAGMVRTDT